VNAREHFKEMRKISNHLTFIITALLVCSVVSADTVILKDGKRMKGLILDEYSDRVVFSTVEGEKTIMKSDIRSAVYDSEAKAMMQKGRNQQKKGQHIKAYYTYEKVLELDPGLEEARQRYNYLRRFLETKLKRDIVDDVRARGEREKGAESIDPLREARDELGIVLVPGEKFVRVGKVLDRNDTVTRSGIREGDRIVSVWGEMAAYLDPDEVAGMMLSSREIKVEIERTAVVGFSGAGGGFFSRLFKRYGNIIGASVGMKKKGLMVRGVHPGGAFDKAGIREGDLLCRIGGKNTRYVSMPKIVDLIIKDRAKDVEIVFSRNIVFWGKGGLS